MKTLAFLFLLPLAFLPLIAQAQIQPRFNEAQCYGLAQLMGDAVMFRDAGADPEKHFKLLTAGAEGSVPKPLLDMIDREMRRVYRGKDTAQEVYDSVLKRCLESGGTMGTDV